eukprot:12839486-Alexandrium_andersonii.AAC.1
MVEEVAERVAGAAGENKLGEGNQRAIRDLTETLRKLLLALPGREERGDLLRGRSTSRSPRRAS